MTTSKQFPENLNTAVLTSKYVLARESEIIYIAHHADGMWEFWGKEQIDESEIVVVALSDIINLDPTVLEVADLPNGFNALRESRNDKWKIVGKN